MREGALVFPKTGFILLNKFQTFQNMRRGRGGAQVAAPAVRQEREDAAQRHERVRGGADEGPRHRRRPEGHLRLESGEARVAEERNMIIRPLHVN